MMARIPASLILLATSACAQQYPPQQMPSGVHRTSPLATPSAAPPQQQAPATAQELQQWHYPDGSIRWGFYDHNTGIMKPAPQAQQWYYPDGSIRWGVYDHNTGIMKELIDR